MSEYVFIDGEALLLFMADAAERLTPGEQAPINYDLMRGRLGGDRVFFYDAYPTKRLNEGEEEFRQRWDEKDKFLKELSRLDAMHVRTGTSRHRKKRGVEQKGVDVQLAIEAYQHAVRGNIDTAIIITNDLDFYPLLDAMTQTRVRTRLRYDRSKTSGALIEAADFANPLLLLEIASWCDPPYSNHGGLRLGERQYLQNYLRGGTEIRRGRFRREELVVYRNEPRSEFIIDPGPEENVVMCNNLEAGIDWIEIHLKGDVVF